MSVRSTLSSGPTVYRFRYERPDGAYRNITVAVGRGRFRRGRQTDAHEIAERRLSEQYGQALFIMEQQQRETNSVYIDATAERIRNSQGLHQDNYTLVSVVEVKRG